MQDNDTELDTKIRRAFYAQPCYQTTDFESFRAGYLAAMREAEKCSTQQ